MPYVPSGYWSGLHDRRDLSAVGQSGLPAEMNEVLYRIQRRNLAAFLGRNGADRIAGAAFDVGSGSGYWVAEWLAAGAGSVDGCDLVPAAVERLQAEFGSSGRFVVADVGGSAPLAESTYQFVSCMNVLLHLTDDRLFERALANIAGLLAANGRLLLAEPILNNAAFERPFNPDASSRARSLAAYRGGLERCGLRLVDLAPATAVAANPIESRTRLGFFAWRALWAGAGLPSKLRPANAGWTGAVLGALDPLLLKLGAAPSSKFALFERPATQ